MILKLLPNLFCQFNEFALRYTALATSWIAFLLRALFSLLVKARFSGRNQSIHFLPSLARLPSCQDATGPR